MSSLHSSPESVPSEDNRGEKRHSVFISAPGQSQDIPFIPMRPRYIKPPSESPQRTFDPRRFAKIQTHGFETLTAIFTNHYWVSLVIAKPTRAALGHLYIANHSLFAWICRVVCRGRY